MRQNGCTGVQLTDSRLGGNPYIVTHLEVIAVLNDPKVLSDAELKAIAEAAARHSADAAEAKKSIEQAFTPPLASVSVLARGPLHWFVHLWPSPEAEPHSFICQRT